MQSTLSPQTADSIAPDAAGDRFHLAIILDGNGRWARARGLPRQAGHRAGARAVRRTVEAAGRRGIGFLTLFAFSADNWKRPREEVAALMTLLGRYLDAETERCVENGLRLNVIGRRDRLEPRLVRAIAAAESATAAGDRMLLRIAVDYSARQTLCAAAARLAAAGTHRATPPGPEELEEAIAAVSHSISGAPAVDLLVRTSGEQRLSDFLLWESAYAELYFTPTLWPDFDAAALDAALADYARRERRFGRVPRLAAAAGAGALG